MGLPSLARSTQQPRQLRKQERGNQKKNRRMNTVQYGVRTVRVSNEELDESKLFLRHRRGWYVILVR